MIELIDDLPDHVVGLTATGQVSGEDYQDVLIPAVERKLEKFAQIDLLYHLDADFKRFTTTALWDDAKVGLHHLNRFKRVAVVSDVGWINNMAKGIGLVAPAEIRVFPSAELAAARTWISD